jgi:hypothetical protein
MFRKFLGLDNWTKWVVVFLFGGTLAAISYCIALRNTQLNAVFSHHPGAGNVSAAGTLQLTATLNSTTTGPPQRLRITLQVVRPTEPRGHP